MRSFPFGFSTTTQGIYPVCRGGDPLDDPSRLHLVKFFFESSPDGVWHTSCRVDNRSRIQLEM